MLYLILFINLFAFSPTTNYLEKNNLDTIKGNFSSSFNQNLPFLLEVTKKEQNVHVFGYHGSTQRFRLFQDAIRAVFEEVLETPIQNDFYFFRVPGDNFYDLKDGANGFLKKFDRKKDPKTLEKFAVTSLITPFEKRFNVKVKKQLTSKHYSLLQVFSQEFIKEINELEALDLENETVIKALHSENTPKFIQKALWLIEKEELAFDDFIQKDLQTTKPALQKLFSEVSSVDPLLIEDFLDQQLTLTSIFQANIFTNDMQTFLFPYLDTRKDQQAFVVAMNVPLFGNFFRWDESSVRIFLDDSSIESGDERALEGLQKLFSIVGLDPKKAEKVLNAGYNELKKHNPTQGCLYQFYDETKPPYKAFVDKAAFVSKDFGHPVFKTAPTAITLGKKKLHKNSIDLQLRLVMTNDLSLNPKSPFKVVRYDRLPKWASQAIVNKMRQELKGMKVDKKKRDQYLKKIKATWDQ